MTSRFDHLYIFAALFFGISSQLLIRWQMGGVGPVPSDLSSRILFIARLFTHPWIVLAMVATFLGGVAWMLTLTKFEVSYAYPWMSLNFVLMPVLGLIIFRESFHPLKAIGTALIAIGVFLISRSR